MCSRWQAWFNIVDSAKGPLRIEPPRSKTHLVPRPINKPMPTFQAISLAVGALGVKTSDAPLSSHSIDAPPATRPARPASALNRSVTAIEEGLKDRWTKPEIPSTGRRVASERKRAWMGGTSRNPPTRERRGVGSMERRGRRCSLQRETGLLGQAKEQQATCRRRSRLGRRLGECKQSNACQSPFTVR